MFILKKLLAAAILPHRPLLTLLGLCLIRKYPRLGRTLVLLPIVALLALSTPYVSSQLMRGVEVYPAIKVADLDQAQAIVVLGGGAHYNAPNTVAMLPDEYRWNASATQVRLYNRHHLPILVTGGSPFGGTPEAQLMQKALKEEFLVPVRWVEDQSWDTVENAEYSARILKEAESPALP